MANLSVRGLGDDLAQKLRDDAKRQGVSINTLVLEFIREGLGVAVNDRLKEHHDLDDLAGTWSEENVQEFTKSIADFEKIDKDIWR